MKINQVKLIYFSATGTTRKILDSIAEGIAVKDVAHINLTLPGDAQEPIAPFSDELVVIGAPVYGGRLPVEAINRLQRLKARNTLAVIIVVYGNRDFEDALLELKNLALELGFNPVAGGAFIGEHSFASKNIPIANGRPDRLDVQEAVGFGEKIKERILALQSSDIPMDLKIPGSFPYQASGARPMAVSPVTDDEKCTVCGTCASVCPTEAISICDSVETETDRCIRCCACIKNCPEEARFFKDSMMETITKWLNENCRVRKEPQVFGVAPGRGHMPRS